MIPPESTIATRPDRCRFPRSMVASMVGFPGDGSTYREFGVDVVAWGADTAYVSDEWLAGRIKLARAAGVSLFSANIDVITATSHVLARDEGLQQVVARDLADQPLVVPWFSSVHTNGVPTWMGCTNQPLYQEHLFDKLRRSVALGANALHLDTPEGSHRLRWGGCFCDACVAGFRAYCEGSVPPEELARHGVKPAAGFNYRSWLRARYTPCAFVDARQRGERIPLLADYELYQRRAFAWWVEEMQLRLEAEWARPLPLSTNVYNLRPQSLEVAACSDFLTFEIDHGAAQHGRPAPSTIFVLEMATALDRRSIVSACGWDWGGVRGRNDLDLVRFWIAQAYACGHHFMVPFGQWVITDGQQEAEFYTPPADAILPAYRFVKEHASLLDEAESAPDVALVFDLDRYAEGTSAVSEIFCTLVESGHAVGLVASIGTALAAFRGRRAWPEAALVLLADGPVRDREVRAWLDARAGDGAIIRSIRSGEAGTLDWKPRLRLEPRIAWVAPRRQRVAGRDRWLFHVVATFSDAARAGELEATLWFKPGRDGAKLKWAAWWHQPGRRAEEIAVEVLGGELRIRLPRLAFWGVVELEERT